MELSFNAAYLQDVLGVVRGDVRMHMSQSNTSVLVNQLGDEFHPIRYYADAYLSLIRFRNHYD